MADVTVKRYDTRPKLYVFLTEGSPATAINLSTATSVAMFFRKTVDQGQLFLTKAASIVDAATGKVEVTFTTGDLSAADEYNVEFEITWNDGGKETVPNNGYKKFLVVADLNAA